MNGKGVTKEQKVNASIGHHVRKAIEASGHTVRDVAHAARIREARLNRVLAGADAMTLPELAYLATALDIRPSDLLGNIERGPAIA